MNAVMNSLVLLQSRHFGIFIPFNFYPDESVIVFGYLIEKVQPFIIYFDSYLVSHY